MLRYRFIVHIKVEAYAFGNQTVLTRSAILVNGIDSGIMSRGFHVVVLSDADGRILREQAFDTDSYSNASSTMIQFIDSSPDGSIIVIAVVDEGGSKLSQNARNYIANLGSTYIAELSHKDTLALVTSKGAPKPLWFAEKITKVAKGSSSFDIKIWL